MPHAPQRRLSRRALLRSAAMAPVVAAGCAVIAQPTEENLEALRTLTPIPGNELTNIKAKRHADLGNDANRVTFEATARIMWRHFTYGAEGKKYESGLLEEMDNFTTGAKITENIVLNRYPKNGNDRATNYCAYSAGFEAALAADLAFEDTITKQMYQTAWMKVKTDMDARIARAVGAGNTIPDTGGGC